MITLKVSLPQLNRLIDVVVGEIEDLESLGDETQEDVNELDAIHEILYEARVKANNN